MPGDGRLLVVDAVIEPGNRNDFNKFIDLQMLSNNYGGRERTEAEFRNLFRQTGFGLVKVLRTASMFRVLEARTG